MKWFRDKKESASEQANGASWKCRIHHVIAKMTFKCHGMAWHVMSYAIVVVVGCCYCLGR